MTKKEIVQKIAQEDDLPPTVVQQVVQAVLDNIIETLVREGRIELRNFGIFTVIKRWNGRHAIPEQEKRFWLRRKTWSFSRPAR